jgi:hypothetical protein
MQSVACTACGFTVRLPNEPANVIDVVRDPPTSTSVGAITMLYGMAVIHRCASGPYQRQQAGVTSNSRG